VGPQRRPWLTGAIAFPIGLVVFVLLSMALIQLGLYGPWGASIGGASAGLALLAIAWRRGRLQIAWTPSLIATLIFFGVAAALSSVNLSRLSNDSHEIALHGLALGRYGFDAHLLERLSNWGIFQVVAYAGATLLKMEYLYSLAPVFAASALASFAVLLWESLPEVSPRRRVAAIALPLLVMLSMPLFRFHVTYIHTNMASCVYLFLFVVGFWRAEVKDDPDMLPIAFISLLAFSLLRVEAPLFEATILGLTVFVSKQPRARLFRWTAPVLAIVVLWYLLLSVFVPSDSAFLTPGKCIALAAVLSAAFGAWCLTWYHPFRRLVPLVPSLMGAGCALALVLAFALKWDHMCQSTTAVAKNLGSLSISGFTWYGLILTYGATLLLPSPRFALPFRLGIPLFLGVTVALGAVRVPYRYGVGDSANRMSLHVMLLAFFYFALVFAPLALRFRKQSRQRYTSTPA